MTGAAGAGADGLTTSELATLIPRLAFELEADGQAYRQVEGTLLSADISGFTRLTETLASRGREGAEIITSVVNSCFEDLVSVAVRHGGDVVKFGGDAVLILFTGDEHRRRAAQAGIEMQHALARNTSARRNQLRMTVGLADGVFHAMIIGRSSMDLLLCGEATTETLRLEGEAGKGEVLATERVAAALTTTERAGGQVVHAPVDLEPSPMRDAEDMARFVDPVLLSRFRDYAEVGAEHRQAAVGFVSITGIDARIGEIGGVEVAAELDAFVGSVQSAVEATESTILHSDMAMDGFKLFIAAGVPNAIADPADALLSAALAIRSIDSPFDVRLGLNIGRGFAGFLGSSQRRTFTMMGDAVNTAARMLGPCGVGEIVAVTSLVARARGDVVGDRLAPLTVKGKSVPVDAQRVEALRLEQVAASSRVEFHGRVAELDQLLDSMTDGVGVTIVGPAGSGKSRLRDEALARDSFDASEVLDGAGGRYLATNPYGAFWVAMRRLLDIDIHVSSIDAGIALLEVLGTVAPHLVDHASLIAPTLGAVVDDNDMVRAIAPEFRRDALHEAVADLLVARGVRAVFLEDIQWLDDASTELIGHLDDIATDHGWVVVRSRRRGPVTTEVDTAADVAPVAAGEPGVDIEAGDPGRQISLGPLSDHAVVAIIEATCTRRLLKHELEQLVERAQGNPLFALELAAAAGESAAAVPESIEAVIAARIDRLPQNQRRAVRLASVLGARFARSTYEALVRATSHDLPHDVAHVGDMFTIDGDQISFREVLYRDVAYASLPFAQRKRLHLLIGDHLEATVGDTDEIAALLSEHFVVAGDRRRCWRYSLVGAERAERQYSPADAAVLYRRALDHAPRGIDQDEKRRAHEGLGEALVAAGGLDDAHRSFGRARKATTRNSDEDLRLRCRQADCRDRQGRFSDALRVYTSVLNQTEADPLVRAEALVGRASVLYRLGRPAECRDAVEQARAIVGETPDSRLAGRVYVLLSISGELLQHPGWRSEAVRALDLFRTVGDRSGEAEVLNNLGVSSQVAGDLDDAADAYRGSLELKRLVGDRAGAALVQMNLAEVELDRGVTRGVRSLLEDSLTLFGRAGFAVGTAYTTGLLGRLEMLQRRAGEAVPLLRASSEAFLDLGAEGHSAEMDVYLAEALIDLDAVDEVIDLVQLGRDRLDNGVFESPGSVARRLDRVEQSLGATT